MPTNADMAAKMLGEAAGFFRMLGQSSPGAAAHMNENARVYDQVAAMITSAPTGESGGKSHAMMAGGLLKDAATFLRSVAEQNEPVREQMMENANIFEQLGALVADDPLGWMD